MARDCRDRPNASLGIDLVANEGALGMWEVARNNPRRPQGMFVENPGQTNEHRNSKNYTMSNHRRATWKGEKKKLCGKSPRKCWDKMGLGKTNRVELNGWLEIRARTNKA